MIRHYAMLLHTLAMFLRQGNIVQRNVVGAKVIEKIHPFTTNGVFDNIKHYMKEQI